MSRYIAYSGVLIIISALIAVPVLQSVAPSQPARAHWHSSPLIPQFAANGRAAPAPSRTVRRAAYSPSDALETRATTERAVPENGQRKLLERHLQVLEQGLRRLRACASYKATFVRQEAVGGELLDEESIELKLRREPFSVFMKWEDDGQELLYVEGQHDDRALVRGGGAKRFLGNLKLAPDSRLILNESRYPVTDAGLERLGLRLLEYRRRDLTLGKGVSCTLTREKFDGRDCDCFRIEYRDSQTEPLYRKSITYFERERSVPVCVKNWGWPAPGSRTEDEMLIEYYAYHNLEWDARLNDSDFDLENKEYAFRR